jgi:hypothetical protein
LPIVNSMGISAATRSKQQPLRVGDPVQRLGADRRVGIVVGFYRTERPRALVVFADGVAVVPQTELTRA